MLMVAISQPATVVGKLKYRHRCLPLLELTGSILLVALQGQWHLIVGYEMIHSMNGYQGSFQYAALQGSLNGTRIGYSGSLHFGWCRNLALGWCRSILGL
jgi:hypothetical protein